MPLQTRKAVSFLVFECGWDAHNVLKAQDDRKHAEKDEREDAVAEDRCGAVCVDAALRHEIEKGVHRDGPDQGDAVDVRELRLAGLRECSRISVTVRALGERRTHKEEEGGKDEAEDERSCEVGVVHDVRVD